MAPVANSFAVTPRTCGKHSTAIASAATEKRSSRIIAAESPEPIAYCVAEKPMPQIRATSSRPRSASTEVFRT